MKKLLLTVFGILLFASIPLTASADVNNFTITDFNSDQTLSNAVPQGELHIVEKISVIFIDNNHGLLRAIPQSYKGNNLKLHVNSISSTSGAPTSYTTYNSNGNTVLKIGDPSTTVTGVQDYTIDYTLDNVISFYKDHDELYWDVNGDQWGQPFNQVTATVHLPSGLQQVKTPICYTGSYGSTQQDCMITTTSDGFQVDTTAGLSANQTLTYVAGFNTGYFTPPSAAAQAYKQYAPFVEFGVIAVVSSAASFMWWFKKGRDAKGTGVIVPQYGPPDNMKPLEVGVIDDFKLTGTEITATIIDLAIRGYLKIIETKENRPLLKDKTVYSLQLLKTDQSLNSNELAIIGSLFPDGAAGSTVDISSQRNKLYMVTSNVSDSVEDALTQAGYFRSNPLKAGGVLTAAFGIATFFVYLAGRFLGWAIAGGLIVGIVVASVLSRFMAARTAKGVAAKEYIDGLKLYLNVAEKDRLVKLQAPNAPYAAPSAEPVKTVELFEKLLPYAIVLGVEKGWAGQFESMYTQPPSWYSGNWQTFNAVYLTSSLMGGLSQTVNTAFSPPSSSGSSGFGGGGFSGGGGGGGGGGGW